MAGRPNNKYSAEFKKEAVEKFLNGKIGGLESAARKLGLRSHTQLKKWTAKYLEDPELLKVDGRGKGSLKEGVRKGRPKKVDLRNLSLEEQVEYLKMENAVLKKVKALRKNYGEH